MPLRESFLAVRAGVIASGHAIGVPAQLSSLFRPIIRAIRRRPVRFVQKVVSNRSSRPVRGPAEESIDALFEAIGRCGRTTYPFSQVILRRFRRFSNNSIHLPSVGSGWRVARIGREVLQRGTERAREAGGEMVCKRRRCKGDGQSIERRG